MNFLTSGNTNKLQTSKENKLIDYDLVSSSGLSNQTLLFARIQAKIFENNRRIQFSFISNERETFSIVSSLVR